MKALIVEDEGTSAKILERALDGFAEVTVVSNAEAGFGYFEMALESGNPFDVICLDVTLPGFDGIEMLDEIRKLEETNGIVGSEGVKVIVTTGAQDTETFVDASEAGCTSYLIKPVNPQKLLSELRRLGLIVT